MNDDVILKIETGLPDVAYVGKGTAFVLKGYCFGLSSKVKELRLDIGGKERKISHTGETRQDVYLSYLGVDKYCFSLSSGFHENIYVTPEEVGEGKEVSIRVIFENGECLSRPVKTISIKKYEDPSFAAGLRQPEKKLTLCICMATYEPDINSFSRQIKSICEQTFTNWICIINDDCSSAETYAKIKQICKDDSRIYLYRNETNTGFYRNYEISLSRVPDDIEFVAFADQDDYWYPEKISKTMVLFDGGTMLVYTDMRIVTNDGETIADTYWYNRKNNYADLSVLLLANTVTGAASIFRTDLLKDILPFPQKLGDSFHDHWIACVALAKGEIKYLDEATYDYIQYSSNVIGHCDFERKSGKDRIKSILKWVQTIAKGIWKRIRDIKSRANIKRDVIALRDRLLAIHNYEYRRLELISMILVKRVGGEQKKLKRIRGLLAENWRSMYELLKEHIYIYRRGHTTNDVELRLLASSLVNKLDKVAMRLLRRYLLRRRKNLVSEDARNNTNVINFLRRKIQPLKVVSANDERIRVNIIIPEINLNSLFGGYLGKFNLAKRFVEAGHNVRFIVVDKCDIEEDLWHATVKGCKGMGDVLGRAEILYVYDREREVRVNPNDIVVASTWWTAHIADELVKYIQSKRFLYLIQEYEPFTFAHGTYYAMAKESYNFDHYPLFSSRFLSDYFQINRIGVFRENISEQHEKYMYFENAIQKVKPRLKEKGGSERKRLLFYARSDSHASRNMFEIGYLSLERAILDGSFQEGGWEYYAVGTTYGEIKLPNGNVLTMLGKLDLEAYREMLPDYDVGLSLMYTPHPSLVPLEMASAGMIVVTNTFENKTEKALADISKNIVAGDGTIGGTADMLGKAVLLSNDIEYRNDGAIVNWPSDWNEAITEDMVEKIMSWFETEKNGGMAHLSANRM